MDFFAAIFFCFEDFRIIAGDTFIYRHSLNPPGGDLNSGIGAFNPKLLLYRLEERPKFVGVSDVNAESVYSQIRRGKYSR
jgi:hypothetical protein